MANRFVWRNDYGEQAYGKLENGEQHHIDLGGHFKFQTFGFFS